MLAMLVWGSSDLPKAGNQSLAGQLRAVADDLCSLLNINSQYLVNPGGLLESYGFAHPQQSVEISFARQHLGMISRIHPTIVTALGVDSSDAAIMLLDIDALVDAEAKTKFKFSAPPSFPAVKVDVALALPVAVDYAAAHKAVSAAAGNLLDSIELFDVYSGPGLEEGQHSMAFTVQLRASDRTLGDAEEQKFIKKVSKAAAQLGGNLRS